MSPGSIGQLAVPLRNQIASKSNGSGVKLGWLTEIASPDLARKKGKMKQVGQSKNTLSFKLKEKKGKRTVPYKKGKYMLKVSAFDKKNMNKQWTDEFEVI